MSSKMKFSDGERVLCYHGQLIYEAKLLKCQTTKDKHVKYFIHYAGWNKNWDEWVPENRVLKYNESNVQLQKEIQKKYESSAKSNKKSSKSSTKKVEATKDDATSRSSTPSKDITKEASTSRSRGSSVKPSATATSTTSSKETSKPSDDEATKRKRQRLDTSVSNEGDEKITKSEISIIIPKELKNSLVDDWHAINTQHKLIELPAKLTVEQIVESYVQFKKSKSTNSKELSSQDISNGILEYFNVMLGSQLLYKVERQQYADILVEYPDKPMSQIYGSFHLLRLFVKLGTVLSFTTLDRKNIRVLIGHLGDFLKYLENNAPEFFPTANFSHNQTTEYLRRAAH